MGIYTVLDCFSGYGGFGLGLRLAYPDADFHTVAYIEWDRYCQRVIQARIGDGLLDDAPIWDDIKSFDGTQYRGLVDLVTAGFPCQPHSNAGLRKGADDDRNLWPDTLRIIREVAPRTGVLLENVPGILVGSPPYGGTVVGQLAEVGYDAEWRIISAADAGAPHLRNRWWLLAHPNADLGGRLHRESGVLSAIG
jgi:DNA (cytosine-5)-methyltransferase 1